MNPCRKMGLPVTFVLVLPDCLMLIRAFWCCLCLWFLLPGPTSPHTLPFLSLKTWLGGLNFLTSYLLTSLTHTPWLVLSPHTYILPSDPQCLRVGPGALSEEDPIPSTVSRVKRAKWKELQILVPIPASLLVHQPWCQSSPPSDASFFASSGPRSSHSTPLPPATRALSKH